MAALDDGWHASRPRRAVEEVIGKDQHGRSVYADRCVILPGTLRPDGTRRKDRRVRAEQLKDGSWKSFVPQDEVEAFETRAHREAQKPRAIPGLAPAETPPSDVAAKSKAARKHEARKLRKQLQRDETAAEPDAAEELPSELTAEDFARKAKNLKKKLKQIAELKASIDAGFEPSSDQCVLCCRTLAHWTQARKAASRGCSAGRARRHCSQAAGIITCC